MKLLNLNPSWEHWSGREGRIGINFDCPVHKKTHRVHVHFANPLDGEKPVERNHLWTRTGDSFDTLTLTPSVDYTKYDNGTVRDLSCWHGFVSNGEVT